MELPELKAYGNTAMGKALETAMDMVTMQKINTTTQEHLISDLGSFA